MNGSLWVALLIPAIFTGCASRETVMIEAEDRVYLTTLGPCPHAPSHRASLFPLGAGDALGEALFIGYVASLRQPDDSTRYAEVSAVRAE